MHMIDLRVDSGRLSRFVASQGQFGRDDDYGYAIHSWLLATFGNIAPKPFRLLDQHDLRVLAYSQFSFEQLLSQAKLVAEPAVFAVCDWAASAGKEMPIDALVADRVVNFEVRVCPVTRSDAGERDIFLSEVEYAEQHGRDPRSRSDLYVDWLSKRIQDSLAALVLDCTLIGFRRVSSIRKAVATDKKRKSASIQRPDALLSGRLMIKESARFVELLAHGIGRHRSFGYGMMLIRP